MKIMHTSDWHLGRVLHRQSLLEDQREMLNTVLEELKNGGYTAILISGDIYDRAVPPAEAVKLFDTFITSLTELKIQAVILAGNHDSAARLGFGADIMAASGIHFRCSYEAPEIPVRLISDDGSEADVFTLPFVDAAFLRQELNPEEELANNLDEDDEPKIEASREELVKCMLERMIGGRRDGIPAILMAHEFVGKESKTTDSERVFIGGSYILDESLFAEFDYVALGHLHQQQRAGADHIQYSGSPLPYSFSEANHEKAILSLTTTDTDSKVGAAPIPIDPPHPVSVITGTYQELMTDPKYEAFANHYVMVQLTDSDLHINLNATLKERFPFILHSMQLPLEAKATEADFSARAATSPTELFSLFLDYFGWEDETERKRATEIFEKTHERVMSEEREGCA